MIATFPMRRDILEESARASGPALRAFESIALRWALRPKDAATLLGLPRSTYFAYAKAPEKARLSRDTLERISYVLGIFKALAILLPRNESADTWVRNKNGSPIFNGHAPLELMLGGRVGDLYVVRHYLDSERGW